MLTHVQVPLPSNIQYYVTTKFVWQKQQLYNNVFPFNLILPPQTVNISIPGHHKPSHAMVLYCVSTISIKKNNYTCTIHQKNLYVIHHNVPQWTIIIIPTDPGCLSQPCQPCQPSILMLIIHHFLPDLWYPPPKKELRPTHKVIVTINLSGMLLHSIWICLKIGHNFQSGHF
jgi:hypothetical protein